MTKPVDGSSSSEKDAISASPYYLHPSDHPHHVLTPMLLNGDNYERWAKLTRNNLQAKRKLGFIDGTLTKPPSDSPDYPRWLQTNSMLVENMTSATNSSPGITSPVLAYDDDDFDLPTSPDNTQLVVTPTTEPNPVLDTSPDSTPGPSIVYTTPAATPPAPIVPLRRGLRNRQESVRLKDYETYSAQCDYITPPLTLSPTTEAVGKCVYPMANFVSCERFSESHQHFLAAINQGTWDITPLPHGVKPIGSKWVFRIKYNSDGTIERYKARLVALGNHQKEGVDFTETFAPVVKMQTVRLLLDVAAAKNWELHQMDVYNAFLHGDLKEDIYMKPPPGFKTADPSHVCKLKKSIYGLKQAPRCWFEKLSVSLLKYGFVQSKKDYSLFTSIRGSTVLHVIVYVDDLVICGNDASVIAKFKTYLSQCFKMKDLGPLKYFLGIEVARNPEGIFLSQRKYCLDVIEECGLSGSRPAETPLEQNHKLASSTSSLFSEPDKYRRLVGRLVYLTHTKPEISYAVNMLAQFMQKPLLDHWEAALRLVRYLKGCPGQGILLSSTSDLQLKAFSDSDHAGCPLTRRSLTGYLVKLGPSPVSWKTKKQDKVSRSSAEAEYRAMAMTCQELMWVKELSSPCCLCCSGVVPSMVGFSSLVGGEAARGLACRTVQGTVACTPGELLNSVLEDGAVSGFSPMSLAPTLSSCGVSLVGFGCGFAPVVCVWIRRASLLEASCGVTLAPWACSLRLEALGVLVFGGQRFSSVGGLLRVAASSTMVMASPCPFVFVPVASFPVALR
ncbi:Reverse transcriptase RNA-dependent DNA polymerase [Arabidopsis thaliana x Arabidopsis arenosa]|uniref:Reverse transcriptase RNA-dependent DNA polymerase n=1 Tax=Arabidopsis thaliana x Arabidopsis arenosa TaxID=1240361 RepID=A0A8T1XDX5_9BRAS|nr:Reverse transcriptase RNA-dependent DNA polymerase [Arabidopsis thaliana x Arabidopsis arenosa]